MFCTSSGLANRTSGISLTACASSIVRRTRLPARSPPACMLVCPGHRITTPEPNALEKPRLSAPWNPLPYDRSMTTETMPQEMPSIDSPARKRLRASPYIASRAISRTSVSPRMRERVVMAGGFIARASKLISVMSHLVAERFHGWQFRGTSGGIDGRDDADEDEREDSHQARKRAQDHAAEALRHRRKVDEGAKAECDGHAERAAHE